MSSDLVLNNNAAITAANFSAGWNGNNTLNLPKGTITLNNSSTFTVSGNGAFNLAESVGSNMTMTLNGSSQLTASGRQPNISATGHGNAHAEWHQLGLVRKRHRLRRIQNRKRHARCQLRRLFTVANEIRVSGTDETNATFTGGTGVVNVNGGTLNAVAITLGRGTWKYPTNGSTFNGTLNVSNGGVVNLASGDSFVAYADRQARREQSTSVAAVSMSARRPPQT